jgi:hypothetical protein
MFLDTGVSPSVIDISRARALGLDINPAGGEASGDGNAKHAMAYPTSIGDLTINGRRFAPIDALAIDMKKISGAYGRPVDGILGYSFLVGRIFLIDYTARTITIYDDEVGAVEQLKKCRKAWHVPLRSFQSDHIPIVDLGVGGLVLPASIDTGSNGSVEIFGDALNDRSLKSELAEVGTKRSIGARGDSITKVVKLNAPINLGPFTLPAGQTVTVSSKKGSAKTRLANVGNKILARMQLKLLLDYRKEKLSFFGDCPG